MKREKEGDIVRAILDYCHYKKIIAWRNQSGAVITASGSFIRMSRMGVSDIIAVQPRTGKVCCMECKTKTGRLTPYQKEFIDDVKAAGGIAGVVRSVEDAEKLLDPTAF
jgi:hypothetical protein